MAVYDSTNIKDSRVLLSQTPVNATPKNYFLKELQEKVNADWTYRPNHFIIERENGFGTEDYEQLEVVLQTVRNDRGEKVSDDWLRVVFKNIFTAASIGQRYRFSYDFNIESPPEDKNVWIATNQNQITPTNAQVVCRCNGTLASIYTDILGNNVLHYEPVVQTTKFNSAEFDFSKVAVDPDGKLTIIAQYNKFTDQYYINQRFIIGPDRVYKVENILKTDALYTYKPRSAGLVRLYLSMDQIGELDNFETRLAYNGLKDTPVTPVRGGSYSIGLAEPTSVPPVLTTLTFKPQVFSGDTPTDIPVTVTCHLEGTYAQLAQLTDYVRLEGPDSGGLYTATRLAEDITLKAVFELSATLPDGSTIMNAFDMRLYGV